MFVCRAVSSAILLASLAVPASAASFDCAKATTPFEQAICNVPELSTEDELLAKTFATATGGLTKDSVVLMRADQRQWLDYAQRVCTDDAKVMTSGNYSERGGECLVQIFADRRNVLEESRMLDGHRFFSHTRYDVMPDPDEVDNPESYWKLASQELAYPQLDTDHPDAAKFNAWVAAQAETQAGNMFWGGDLEDGVAGTSDNSVKLAVKELAGEKRITLSLDTYWFGHGGAHGNWTVNYLHYFVPEAREVTADDIFTGDNWKIVLRDAAWAQLQLEHPEWLYIDNADNIADVVVDPSRWVLSNDYGLQIQFQPYEVAAYAYGAPTITIAWDKLDAIKAENQETVRYGR